MRIGIVKGDSIFDLGDFSSVRNLSRLNDFHTIEDLLSADLLESLRDSESNLSFDSPISLGYFKQKEKQF